MADRVVSGMVQAGFQPGPWRIPSEVECQLVDRLLSEEFSGREEVVAQFAQARVRSIDAEGSLALEVPSEPLAEVQYRVPVSGIGLMEEGTAMEFLIHVVDGHFDELEVVDYCRLDGDPVRPWPNPATLEVMVVPWRWD
jgi:hypothetical protein